MGVSLFWETTTFFLHIDICIYAIHTHAQTIYVMYIHVCMYTYTRVGFAVWELGVRVSGLLDMTGGWHGAKLSPSKGP